MLGTDTPHSKEQSHIHTHTRTHKATLSLSLSEFSTLPASLAHTLVGARLQLETGSSSWDSPSHTNLWHDPVIRHDVFIRMTWHQTGSSLLDTGWRRLIGCLKLQVIFRKRATNYRALLWKMTYEDNASYASSHDNTWHDPLEMTYSYAGHNSKELCVCEIARRIPICDMTQSCDVTFEKWDVTWHRK